MDERREAEVLRQALSGGEEVTFVEPPTQPPGSVPNAIPRGDLDAVDPAPPELARGQEGGTEGSPATNSSIPDQVVTPRRGRGPRRPGPRIPTPVLGLYGWLYDSRGKTNSLRHDCLPPRHAGPVPLGIALKWYTQGPSCTTRSGRRVSIPVSQYLSTRSWPRFAGGAPCPIPREGGFEDRQLRACF